MENRLIEPGRFTILDGGMGTMLQRAGLAPGFLPETVALEQPELLVDIHRAYAEAGAQILCANTFGCNGLKLAGSGITVEAAVTAAVRCAKKGAGGRARVALDVGPLGELLEPGGTLSFEEAYRLFAGMMRAGEQAGADLIFIETMADLYEVKAAVLAAKENTALPVLASMTFEAGGRSFTGVPVEAFAAAIGGPRVAALGINCSLGPIEVMPLVSRLCAATPLPVFAKPNAGLPDPATGEHLLTDAAFAAAMRPCLDNGVAMVGGCCGTTPDTIRLLAREFAGKTPATVPYRPVARLCGATKVVAIDRPMAIGERINPTGKKRLREALQAGDLSYVQTLAVEQERAGAAILDVNVGAPGVDEAALLPKAVKAVQAVSGLPLMLDSADPAALEAALRVCIGKPVVNSTSGEAAKLDAVLPLCKRYGAAVLGLALDGNGISETPDKRLAIAQKILNAALVHGIPRQDVWIDCLTLAAGAQPGATRVTLDALGRVKEKLGLVTVLGVSNVSFGLPERPLLNRTFLTMALEKGLDLPIMNPSDREMMATLLASGALLDAPGATDTYVGRFSGADGEGLASSDASSQNMPVKVGGGETLPLDRAIERGLKAEAAGAASALLAEDPGAGLSLVETCLIPALDAVGRDFEAQKLFLPQLLAAAGAAQAAFEVVRAALPEGTAGGPPVVVATVQGDIHDIGKNIAKVLLENYGFTVIDLGRDVPPGAVVQAAKESGARLVGLSALMTTTLPAMEKTIRALREAGLGCKVLVGGAVLTAEYAAQIGADFYAPDAKASADYARSLHG